MIRASEADEASFSADGGTGMTDRYLQATACRSSPENSVADICAWPFALFRMGTTRSHEAARGLQMKR